ncbi:MAG TPA: M14 family metallopeptidase [Xanthobacteraceae bacterium]|nr:M14 family metallopeptidase [Xanthobacteraceae bacterium]
MADLTAFSETYLDARSKFLAAATSAGGTVTSYHHAEQTGPAGEALYFDVARLGNANAEKVLVVGAGTHGIEGYPGSAAQTNWLRQLDTTAIPRDVSVLLFHGHNPWGFAHAMRFTEENVDLNRNFVDFGSPLPANPGYARVHEIIAREHWNDDDLPGIFEGLNALREEIGEQAFSDAINGGQYTHTDGIFYGGARVQWSNRAFRHAVQEHLAQAKSAALIDLHTGIGPRNGHIFLCFHRPGSDAYERARSWWGERAVNREGVTHKAVADYQGLLVDAFVAMLPALKTTAIVVEFGTLPREQMQRAAFAARWLWASRAADSELTRRLRQIVREAYYPSAADWRAAALLQSKEIIDHGLRGIAHDR